MLEEMTIKLLELPNPFVLGDKLPRGLDPFLVFHSEHMHAQVLHVCGTIRRESGQPNACLTDCYLMYVASIELPYYDQQGPQLSDLPPSVFYDLGRWKTCYDSIFNTNLLSI